MKHFVILLLVVAGLLFYLLVYNNPRRWLEASPAVLTNEGIHIDVRNKAGHRVVLDRLGLGWQMSEKQFGLFWVDDQVREIPPGASLSETVPFDVPAFLEETDRASSGFLTSSVHRIVFNLIVDGKRRVSRGSEFSCLDVPLVDHVSQPAE